MEKKLKDIILPAYNKCTGFGGICKDYVIWDPKNGHIPRGYCGALGRIEEVKLVLVMAEPGNPSNQEKYFGPTQEDYLQEHINYVSFKNGNKFHSNVRLILSLCFPDMEFSEIFKKVWITESVLCSTGPDKSSTGTVPKCVVKECGNRYLKAQRQLFENAYWVAVGAKARNRMQSLKIFFNEAIIHPAPPAGLTKKAIESWESMAKAFRQQYF
jgi:hypothetical protein